MGQHTGDSRTDSELIEEVREHFKYAGPNLPVGKDTTLELASRLEISAKRVIAQENAIAEGMLRVDSCDQQWCCCRFVGQAIQEAKAEGK